MTSTAFLRATSRTALALLVACVASAPRVRGVDLPRPADLVLHLKASGTTPADGSVVRWASSGTATVVTDQDLPGARPVRVGDGIGGKPVVRFGGDDFLQLHPVDALPFERDKSFTIVVVFDVPLGQQGTFLARGGGPLPGRSLQVYVNPTRLGAIVFGNSREVPRGPMPGIAVLAYDGKAARVFLNGEELSVLPAGNAVGTGDVLIGARRKDENAPETYYGLEGDIAELLVYRSALRDAEVAALTAVLSKTYGLTQDQITDSVRDLPPFARAEALMHLAQQNRLTDALASVASELLDDVDPFVRAMAAWAVSMKVGHENNKQTVAWPRPDPPAWFERWRRKESANAVEFDWCRQAVALGMHGDAKRLATDIAEIARRSERLVASFATQDITEADVARIDSLLAQLQSAAESARRRTDGLQETQTAWLAARRLQRQVAFANPATRTGPLLFVTRYAPHTIRNITRAYPWKHKPGGGICVLSDIRGGQVQPLLTADLGRGHVRGIDLSWDAKRAVFGYTRQPDWPPDIDTTSYDAEGKGTLHLRNTQEPMHVFEIGTDGSGLRQLTDHSYWSDFEPTYCANGDVVFASERCARSTECGRFDHDHTNVNLYVVRPIAGTVRRFTDCKDVDRYPHSLDDGTIAFTRWEYQERHFMEVHAIWTGRPDGTMVDALFKQHMSAPCGLRDTRSIPGSNRLVSIATGHHTFAVGPVCIVDPRAGLNNVNGLRVLTPNVTPQEGRMAGEPVENGGVRDAGGLYRTPWALSDTCFLAAYAYPRVKCSAHGGYDSNAFGLYLIDSFGNKELVHRDPLLGSVFPIPLRPRPIPPVIPEADAPELGGTAVCVISDVYDGLDGIPRGTVKRVRVSQHLGWPFDPDVGAKHYLPGSAFAKEFGYESWSPVRVLGETPVADDGSACFTVPADTALYFQAIDAHGMEIRRMRSMVAFRPGETRGCRGCHESQARAPAVRAPRQAALRSPPSELKPPPWGADRALGYEWLVQPVLDRNCIRCHAPPKPGGGLDFTGTRDARGFAQSFRTLMAKPEGTQGLPLVSTANRFSNAAVSQPKAFGSHRSRFILTLLNDPEHKKRVTLPPADWQTLVTWVDANTPYHGTFINKRPPDGQGPLREECVLADEP